MNNLVYFHPNFSIYLCKVYPKDRHDYSGDYRAGWDEAIDNVLKIVKKYEEQQGNKNIKSQIKACEVGRRGGYVASTRR